MKRVIGRFSFTSETTPPLPSMKQYRVYQAPWLAFYSRDFYRDVAREWRGTGLGYLFMLVALISLMLCVRLHFQSQKAPGEARPFLEQFPEELTITKGIISTKENAPYTFNDPETGKATVIIDTRQEKPPTDLGDVKLFVARTKIAFQKNKYETRVFDLAAIDNLVLTPQKLERWIGIFFKWIATVLFPFVLGGLYFYRCVQALLFSVVTLILLKIFKAELGYGAVLRLTVIAMSAPLLVFEIVRIAGQKLPLAGTLYFFIVLALIFFAAHSQKEQTPPVQDAR